MCAFSPSCRVGQAFCTCSLAVCKGSHSPSMRTLSGTQTQEEEDGFGKALGVPMGQFGGSTDEAFPEAHEGLSDGVHKEASRICMSSVHSEPWLLYSQPLPGPWSHSSPQYSGWRREKFSWAMSYMAGKPGSHSQALAFPQWRTHVPKGSPLGLSCAPWSRG